MFYELRNLKKTFEQRTVLDIKTLSMEKGKILGLLGPNGAGKTTLLEILALVSSPTSGEIWFERDKVNYTGGSLISLRRRVVLLQQQPILFTTTVAKNVEFPLRIRNIQKTRREGIVDELLELVGMGAFRNARAHRLSGGETQRVAIARALACFPDVILLDEPTASVDVENQIAIERIIREINREKGISIIFTTHDMIQASRLADKIVFLFEGKVARSIYENIFSGHVEMDAEGRKFCILPNGLKLKVQSEKTGQVRISIDPNAVGISKGMDDFSRENTFEGRLIQLNDEQRQIRALVDAGVPISVLIPKDVFRSLHLVVGEKVWLTCPLGSLGLFWPSPHLQVSRA
jgi:tungstate transport system ATP-binding protein